MLEAAVLESVWNLCGAPCIGLFCLYRQGNKTRELDLGIWLSNSLKYFQVV